MERQLQKVQLLRRPDVEKRTGLKRSHIYALMKAGSFPQSVPLGGRAVAWIESEVDNWIAGRIEKRQVAA